MGDWETRRDLQDVVKTFIDALQRLPYVQKPTSEPSTNSDRIQAVREGRLSPVLNSTSPQPIRRTPSDDDDSDDSPPSCYLFEADPYDRDRTDSMKVMDRRGRRCGDCLGKDSAVYPTQSDMEMARRIDQGTNLSDVQGISNHRVSIQMPANLTPEALQRAGPCRCDSVDVLPQPQTNSERMMERRRENVLFPSTPGSPAAVQPAGSEYMLPKQPLQDPVINQVFQPRINLQTQPRIQLVTQAAPGQPFVPVIVSPPQFIYIIPNYPHA